MDVYLQAFLSQLVILSIVFFLLQSKIVKNLLKRDFWFFSLLSLIVFTQLLTSAFLKKEVGDVMLFSGAGYHYRYNSDFYFIDQGHTQYPFFPFLIFLHAFLNWLTVILPGVTFSFYLKIILLGALLGISYIIKEKQQKLLFLTHPITTMVIFFHGQVDVILLFFLVLSLIFLFTKKQNWWSWLAGVLSYTASIASKTWSIILLPWLIWREKSWAKRLLLPVLVTGGLLFDVFVYTRTVHGSSISTVLPAVLKPGGPVGYWGISLLLQPWQELLADYNLYIFAGLFALLAIPVVLQNREKWTTALLLILSIYIVIPNWGIQYLFWALPFVFLSERNSTKEFLLYSFFGSFFALWSYINVAVPGTISDFVVKGTGLIVWCIVIWWWWNIYFSQNKNIS